MKFISTAPQLSAFDVLSCVVGSGYTESASAIINAMREANVRRLVTMTAWFTDSKSSSSVRANSIFVIYVLMMTRIRVQTVVIFFHI